MKTTAKQFTAGAAALMILLVADLSVAAADDVVPPTPWQQLAHGLNPLNWRMPQWRMPNFRQVLPASEEKARIKKKKDGLVDEVSKTASNSWRKTKEATAKLNPVNFFPASARTPTSTERDEQRPGFFRSLFAPRPPEPSESTTVTDFLRQSRPTP